MQMLYIISRCPDKMFFWISETFSSIVESNNEQQKLKKLKIILYYDNFWKSDNN